MVMWVDATKNPPTGTAYRTELRELINGSSDSVNWSTQNGTHTLSARLRIEPNATPTNQITVLQIHPYAAIEPLFRLVWYPGGTMKAYYKTDNTGNVTSSFLCPSPSPTEASQFDAQVTVQNKRLYASVNGIPCFGAAGIDVSYWTWEGYFKAGNYASQSYSGVSEVHFYKLDVTHQ